MSSPPQSKQYCLGLAIVFLPCKIIVFLVVSPAFAQVDNISWKKAQIQEKFDSINPDYYTSFEKQWDKVQQTIQYLKNWGWRIAYAQYDIDNKPSGLTESQWCHELGNDYVMRYGVCEFRDLEHGESEGFSPLACPTKSYFPIQKFFGAKLPLELNLLYAKIIDSQEHKQNAYVTYIKELQNEIYYLDHVPEYPLEMRSAIAFGAYKEIHTILDEHLPEDKKQIVWDRNLRVNQEITDPNRHAGFDTLGIPLLKTGEIGI